MAATASTSQTKYKHSEKIVTRRKALFPSNESTTSGSDLGHMSPIHSENSNFSDCAFNALEHEADQRFRKFFKYNLDDYVLLDDDSEVGTHDICSESSLPPLYLSPMQTLLSTPILYSPMHTQKIVTPLGKSPSSTLKTPHDTSTVKVNQKHTKRKLSDTKTFLNDAEMQSQSPVLKQQKLNSENNKSSKVRTALFPENEDSLVPVLPAKSFYPKDPNFNAKESIAALVLASRNANLGLSVTQTQKRTQVKKFNTLTAQTKRRYGEINAGVRHKIRKPKQKIQKATMAKIGKIVNTMKIVEKSPLTEYLEEMTNVKKTIKPLTTLTNTTKAAKLVEDKENTNTVQTGKSERRFFKSLRSSNLKDAHDTVKPSETQQQNKRKIIDYDTFELSPVKELVDTNILTNIVQKLDTDTSGVVKPNVTTTTTSVKTLDPNLIFSPTTQMCSMASALDLNSPKRAKLNISKMLNDGTIQRPKSGACSEKIEKSAKLFPLFYGDNNKSLVTNIGTNQNKEKKSGVHQTKRFKSIADNQLLIDAGQKKFGATECHECLFVYEVGDPTDEMIHRTYHDAINTFKFNGWKNERVVTNIDLESKVIKIIPTDPKVWWKKGMEVMEFINRELGFYDGVLPIEKSQMYLYVKNKKIIGCLTAELKQTAYKLLPTDLDIDICSEESYNVRCGISRIWVAPHHRRSGIATQMLDTLRRNFLHGYILALNEIATSSPTDLGQKFARKYFKTESFLVCMH